MMILHHLEERPDNIKRPDLRFAGVDEGSEVQTKGVHNLLNEITTESFPNLMKEKENQRQEADRMPNIQNDNRPTPRHIIMTWPSK